MAVGEVDHVFRIGVRREPADPVADGGEQLVITRAVNADVVDENRRITVNGEARTRINTMTDIVAARG